MSGVLQNTDPPPHKVRTYKEYHSVCPSSELGLPPTPHPQASVPPPTCFWGGGEHSLARKGLGESQFRRGAYTVVLFICGGGGGGVHTRRAVKGWGVNILEDAKYWIGLLQYNPSTGLRQYGEHWTGLPFFRKNYFALNTSYGKCMWRKPENIGNLTFVLL